MNTETLVETLYKAAVEELEWEISCVEREIRSVTNASRYEAYGESLAKWGDSWQTHGLIRYFPQNKGLKA